MKKTLSAILAGVFAFSTLSALAAELPGKYPEHKALTARQHRTGTAVPGASPEENVFYVENDNGDAKGFVLLDRDAEGNYFVISEDSWGRSACYPQGNFYPLSDGISTHIPPDH